MIIFYRRLLIFYILFSALTTGCNKNSGINYNLAKINIVGGQCLIIADTSKKAPKAYIQGGLYKLNNANVLTQVVFVNEDNSQILDHYRAERVYAINASYLLLTISEINSNPKTITPYLINIEDGSVTKKLNIDIPKRYLQGAWVIDSTENAVKSANDSCFFYRSEGKICKIKISQSGLITTNEINVSGNSNEFVLSPDELISIDNTILTLTASYVLSGYDNTTHLVSYSNSGFLLTKYTNDSISVYSEIIKKQALVENLITKIARKDDKWGFLDQFSFSQIGVQFIVFDLGIMMIKNGKVSIIKPDVLGINSIKSIKRSKNYLYIEGVMEIDNKGKTVLLKVNPINSLLTYTQLFLVDKYLYKQIQVSDNDDLGIICTNNSDKFEYFIHLTGASVFQQLKNPGLETSQIISIKN